MDRDGRRYQGVGGSSSGDDVHETSFNTASEEGDRYAERGNDASNESIKSSRSMPLPDHMMHRRGNGSDDDALPPPSYNEVMGHGRDYGVNEPEDNEDELTPEEIAIIMSLKDDEINHDAGATGAAGYDSNSHHDDDTDDLNHDNESAVRKRQRDRNDYLPSSDRRHSFEEAIEMQYRKSIQLPKDEEDATAPGLSRAPPPRPVERMEMQDVEHGRERKEFTCSGWGPLDEPMTRFCRFLRRQSGSRLVLFSMLLIGILGLILFVSLFPASFVYIEYHEIALKQSKMTNVIDRDTVYYHGCYVLGPDTQLVKFDASVHNVIEDMSVFTLDTIAVTIRYSVHYFIRPAELGKFEPMFRFDYDDVFRLIIRSSIRNLAGSSLTVDNFRFNRTYVETQMHAMLRKRLGGDCCPDCCKQRPMICQSNSYCYQCKTGLCNQGYHIDVRYFNLLSVSIPNEVFEKLLQRTLMKVHADREFFLQDHALITKESDFLVQNIKNDARQLIEAGKQEAEKEKMIAEGEREKIVQTAHINGLKGLFSQLNVTKESDKLSLMLLRALEDNADNLMAGYGFDKNTLYTP